MTLATGTTRLALSPAKYANATDSAQTIYAGNSTSATDAFDTLRAAKALFSQLRLFV